MKLITTFPCAQFVTMDKQLVDELLSLNTKNRMQRPFVVEGYTRAMKEEFWVPTNQGIGVSASGYLIDGQHRLEALKQIGYPPILMLLVTGLPDQAMAAVDNGSNRTPRDYLQLLFDQKVSAFISAVLRTSMMAERNFIAVKFQPVEFADRLEILGNSISKLKEIDRSSKLPAAVFAALADAHRNYPTEVESFTNALTTGEMLGRDNPALVLRNWIASTKGNGGGIKLVERYQKTTRAMQAWIDQKPLSKLYGNKARLGSAKAENRPGVSA